MAFQLRRGTNAQRLGLTPVEGEMIYITDSILVSISVTSINTTTETLSTTAPHGLSINQQIKYTGATLNGLTKDQVYFVKTAPTVTDFTLSTSLGGGTLNITGTYTVPLVFAKTPTNAAGTPIGYTESALWAGDGSTVGGLAVGITNLDALQDVVITQPVVEGEFLWYDGTNWVNTNETTVDTTVKTLSLTRRATTAVQEYESGPALRLNSRVTDATNDNTDDAGPALRFERSSGTQYEKTYVSGGAIGAFTVTLNNVTNLVVGNKVTGTGLVAGNGALITNISGNQLTLDAAFTVQAAGTYTIGAPVGFGQLAFEYYGTTDVHKFKVTTSTDNYFEDPVDTYPGTSVLIDSTKNATSINEGVLYVDAVNNRIGINNTSPSYDLQIGSASSGLNQFAMTNSERSFIITNNPGNDTLSFNYSGANRLEFDTTNAWFNSGRLGINNSTPLYTLDVNGTANIETSLTVPSITTLTGDNLNITAFSGREVTISTTASTDPVTIARNTTATGSGGVPVRALTLRLDSSNTPVVGFGGSIEFETETTPGTTVPTGYISNQSTAASSGVLNAFEMGFGVMSAGTVTERMVLDNLGNLQIDGNLEVATGSITTSVGAGGIANLYNSNAINVINIGNSVVTEVNIGNSIGSQVQIKSPTIVGANTTQAVFNTVATTVNAFGASTATAIGSTASGTTTIGWDAVVNKDLAVNGGDITTTQANANIFNANATTINIGNGATGQVNIGSSSGTVNIKSPSLIQNDLGGASTTFNLLNTITTDLNIGGAATTVDIGAAAGTTTVAGKLDVGVTLQTASSESVTSGAISLTKAITKFPTTGVNTSTLADGSDGQFKTLVRTGASNSMAVTVSSAGWKGGSSGTINFGDQGDTCLLQFVSGYGWCAVGVGNPQPVFS